MSKDNNDYNRREYNKARNKVQSIMKKLRKEFERRLAQEAKKNPKQIWKYTVHQFKVKNEGRNR